MRAVRLRNYNLLRKEARTVAKDLESRCTLPNHFMTDQPLFRSADHPRTWSNISPSPEILPFICAKLATDEPLCGTFMSFLRRKIEICLISTVLGSFFKWLDLIWTGKIWVGQSRSTGCKLETAWDAWVHQESSMSFPSLAAFFVDLKLRIISTRLQSQPRLSSISSSARKTHPCWSSRLRHVWIGTFVYLVPFKFSSCTALSLNYLSNKQKNFPSSGEFWRAR